MLATWNIDEYDILYGLNVICSTNSSSTTLLHILFPVITLCFAWDGQVSYTRIYTFEDIDALSVLNLLQHNILG